MIEKSCWAGLDDYFSSIIKALNLECEEGIGSAGLKRKTRRRRRATCAGSALQNHSPDNMSPNHQSLPTDLPHIHNNNGIMKYTSISLVFCICNLSNVM